MSQTFTISSGTRIEYRVHLPEPREGQERLPLVFMVPSSKYEYDLDRYIRSFLESGRAVFQIHSKLSLNRQDIEWLYRFASQLKGVNQQEFIYLGFHETADYFPKYYYEFYGLLPPVAAALISCKSSLFELNHITCPYLLIHQPSEIPSPQHSERDRFETALYSLQNRFEEAIYHHQMRYGDSSAHHIVPDLNQTSIEIILKWFRSIPISPDRLPLQYLHRKYA